MVIEKSVEKLLYWHLMLVYIFFLQRREKCLREKGLYYIGCGVSGGEEGARYGPSLMPGGSKEAWLEELS